MKKSAQFCLVVAIVSMATACKTNRQYNDAVNNATNTSYTNGYNDGKTNGYSTGYSDGNVAGASAGFNSGYIAGGSDGYSSGYSAGTTAGYTSGYSDGQTVGYNNGYGDGSSSGYASGYNAGTSDGYTSGYNTGTSDGYFNGYNAGYNSGTNDGYSVGYSAGSNNGYNSGFSAGNAAAMSNLQTVADFTAMIQVWDSNSSKTDSFVKINSSNYIIFKHQGTGGTSYTAYYLPSYTDGMDYNTYFNSDNGVIWDNLTPNGDGTFSCTGCTFSSGGYTGNVTTPLQFEKTVGSTKDLQKAAAISEAFQVKKMSSFIATHFGLSQDRSVQVAKMATAWNKLAKTRAVTDADADTFTKQLTGVSMADMKKAEDSMSVGNMAPLNDVLSKAAAVNGTTSENMANIMNQLFTFN